MIFGKKVQPHFRFIYKYRSSDPSKYAQFFTTNKMPKNISTCKSGSKNLRKVWTNVFELHFVKFHLDRNRSLETSKLFPIVFTSNQPLCVILSDVNRLSATNFLKITHKFAVSEGKYGYRCNKVLNKHPAMILELEPQFLRHSRSILSQLKSGWSNILNFFCVRIVPATLNRFPDYQESPHATMHLFNCPLRWQANKFWKISKPFFNGLSCAEILHHIRWNVITYIFEKKTQLCYIGDVITSRISLNLKKIVLFSYKLTSN